MPAACAKTSLRTGRCKWHGLQALALPWGNCILFCSVYSFRILLTKAKRFMSSDRAFCFPVDFEARAGVTGCLDGLPYNKNYSSFEGRAYDGAYWVLRA